MTAVATPQARLRAPVERALALPVGVRIALGLALLVGVSLLLRSQGLHARYWIDEGLSVGIASHPLADIPGVLRQDGSPPLYYLLLHGWIAVFDRGEADTHVLSLLFALATIPVAFTAARMLFDARTAWIAALLAAINPFLTYYAQETRMYALVALLGLVVTATFALGFVARRRGWLVVFAAALALLLYSHNWGLFMAAATVVAFAVVVRGAPQRRPLLRDGALAYGAVGLVYLPWLPTLAFQARHTGAPWAEVPGLDDAMSSLGTTLGGTTAAVVFGLAAYVGLSRMRRGDPALRIVAIAAGLAIGGIALAWLASQASPAWATRYLAVFVGPLLLAGAALIARAGSFGLVALGVLAILWFDPRIDALEGKSNAHTTAVEVRDRLSPGDLVVSTHPEHGPVMHVYLPAGLRWANSMGPVSDPQVMDWRDAMDRLKAARPTATADALVRTLAPSQNLLLIQPVIRSASWKGPWTALVRRRAAQWERMLDDDPRLARTLAVPKLSGRPLPRGVRAVLYERL